MFRPDEISGVGFKYAIGQEINASGERKTALDSLQRLDTIKIRKAFNPRGTLARFSDATSECVRHRAKGSDFT